jgi:hypothetical protein
MYRKFYKLLIIGNPQPIILHIHFSLRRTRINKKVKGKFYTIGVTHFWRWGSDFRHRGSHFQRCGSDFLVGCFWGQANFSIMRQVEDIKLSRHACYLIVQNADPAKNIVALGQTYFAIQTRKQELSELDEYQRLATEDEKRLFLRNEMKTHNIQLAKAAKDAGVIEPKDYAIFQNGKYHAGEYSHGGKY